MATETGIVMLVYLRGAVAHAGGLAGIRSLEELRTVVLDGAVRRLRPKLLTEVTTLLGLARMLWASGAGSVITRAMVAPVLGGILLADEVIDVFLPVLFFAVEKRRWLRLRRGAVAQAIRAVGALHRPRVAAGVEGAPVRRCVRATRLRPEDRASSLDGSKSTARSLRASPTPRRPIPPFSPGSPWTPMTELRRP